MAGGTIIIPEAPSVRWRLPVDNQERDKDGKANLEGGFQLAGDVRRQYAHRHGFRALQLPVLEGGQRGPDPLRASGAKRCAPLQRLLHGDFIFTERLVGY